MKIKIKTDNNIKFTIPVPYSILRLSSSIMTSKAAWKFVNKKWITDENYKIQSSNMELAIPLLKLLIKELRHFKGLVLVDVTSNDGTKILITL